MLFVSSGQNKLNALRRNALQHLFLFDNTVDKAKVSTPITLMKQSPECRSTTHTLDGNVLSATPIGGVKSGKFYPAHTGKINQFSLIASNLGWYFVTSASDGFTESDHADRFASVAETPLFRTYVSQDANMFGTYSGYAGKNNLDTNRRAYFLPNSRKAIFNGAALKHVPASSAVWGQTTNNGIQDTTRYNQGVECGFFATGETYADAFYKLNGSALLNTGFSGTQVIDIATGLRNQGGVLLLNPAYSWQRTWFANATWYNTSGAGYNWLNNATTAQASAGLPYVETNLADDGPAALSFASVALNQPMARELLKLDIGVDSDLSVNTDTQVGTEPTFTCSTEVLSIININTNYDLNATKFVTQ